MIELLFPIQCQFQNLLDVNFSGEDKSLLNHLVQILSHIAFCDDSYCTRAVAIIERCHIERRLIR